MLDKNEMRRRLNQIRFHRPPVSALVGEKRVARGHDVWVEMKGWQKLVRHGRARRRAWRVVKLVVQVLWVALLLVLVGPALLLACKE
jgi:hypothetical protein